MGPQDDPKPQTCRDEDQSYPEPERAAGDAQGAAHLSTSPDTYISWWPDGKTILGGKAHTYNEHISVPHENGEPDHRINIYTLDEAPMELYWLRFKYHANSEWHLFRNCATLVGRTLRQGGGPFYLGDNLTWTPQQVLDYAIRIAAAENVCR